MGIFILFKYVRNLVMKFWWRYEINTEPITADGYTEKRVSMSLALIGAR